MKASTLVAVLVLCGCVYAVHADLSINLSEKCFQAMLALRFDYCDDGVQHCVSNMTNGPVVEDNTVSDADMVQWIRLEYTDVTMDTAKMLCKNAAGTFVTTSGDFYYSYYNTSTQKEGPVHRFQAFNAFLTCLLLDSCSTNDVTAMNLAWAAEVMSSAGDQDVLIYNISVHHDGAPAAVTTSALTESQLVSMQCQKALTDLWVPVERAGRDARISDPDHYVPAHNITCEPADCSVACSAEGSADKAEQLYTFTGNCTVTVRDNNVIAAAEKKACEAAGGVMTDRDMKVVLSEGRWLLRHEVAELCVPKSAARCSAADLNGQAKLWALQGMSLQELTISSIAPCGVRYSFNNYNGIVYSDGCPIQAIVVPPAPASHSGGGLSGGAIAGIVIGVLVGVAALGAAAMFFLKKRQQSTGASRSEMARATIDQEMRQA